MSRDIKYALALLVVGISFAILTYFFILARAEATGQQHDDCDEVFEYTKTQDFSDNRLEIDFENSDQQIDVAAKAGYQITEVALEVSDDGFPGFHVYATGEVSNFNPPGSQDINAAKVKVKKVCPTPTVTPSPTVTEPTPTGEVTVTPSPTETPARNDSTPSGGGSTPSSTYDPTCPIHDIGNVANINVVTTGNKEELQVQWALPGNADRVHIEYGLQQSAEHALLETPNDGNEVIKHLTSGQHYWFRVAGVRGCGVGPWSNWFDPIVP